jgi:hypothetical protein
MGCRSDYMEPTDREIELGRVLSLLAELDGQKVDHSKSTYDFGYENRSDSLDAKTAELCARCKTIDVTKYSLELQFWWREHQAADARREEKERQIAARQAKLEEVKKKLTKKEQILLGIK